jgi:hypothetical protein
MADFLNGFRNCNLLSFSGIQVVNFSSATPMSDNLPHRVQGGIIAQLRTSPDRTDSEAVDELILRDETETAEAWATSSDWLDVSRAEGLDWQ